MVCYELAFSSVFCISRFRIISHVKMTLLVFDVHCMNATAKSAHNFCTLLFVTSHFRILYINRLLLWASNYVAIISVHFV